MRRTFVLLMTLGLLLGVGAAPGVAKTTVLDGPDPAIWLADPDGVDGTTGVEQFSPVAGSSGTAKLNKSGATITVKATGLVPGHTYTMWVVYFNDQSGCMDFGSGNAGCNGEDLSMSSAKGGVLFGNGQVAGGSGKATFTAHLSTGDNAANLGPPPPPFGFAPYEAGEDNEFHVVIRSHGPKIAGRSGRRSTRLAVAAPSSFLQCLSRSVISPSRLRKESVGTSSFTCSSSQSAAYRRSLGVS